MLAGAGLLRRRATGERGRNIHQELLHEEASSLSEKPAVTAHAQFCLNVSLIVRSWFATLWDQRDYLPGSCREFIESRTDDQADQLVDYVAGALAPEAFAITGNAKFSPTVVCQVTVNLDDLVEGLWAVLAQEAADPAGGELIPADVAEAFASVHPSVWQRLKPALLHGLGADFRPYLTADTAPSPDGEAAPE